jgi:molybdenum cofactor cytidylyltransferase
VIFGVFGLDDALGAVVAHTHRVADRVIRKGSVLDEAAVSALRQAGRTEVIAARLDPTDVTEDEAAGRVAALLVGPGFTAGRAATGRVNLHAEAAGLLRVDAAKIDRLNLLSDALTVATLPDYAVVGPRDMVATIKVIPFAVPGCELEAVERAAGTGETVFTLHPFRALKVGLVLSELPGLKQSVVEGTIEATRARVTALGGTLLPPLRAPHTETAIAAALRQLMVSGVDLLLVAGASATVDRRDVGPAAVVRASGDIVHFGMPVDPGNLICVGRIGDIPALVLPGCARSPKPNGIDLVLHRLFAGLPAGGPEIMRMGVGGLLKDTDRPLPRARTVRAEPAAPRGPTVAAIVLAAGKSTRMAPYNKLLIADRTGKAMVARVIDNILSSRARPVLVVTGHRGDEVREAIGKRPVTFVEAADYANGLAASLKAGVSAAPTDASAALVCLGDMPLVTGRMIDRIIDNYDPDEGRLIVTPTHAGQVGNPILWDRSFFAEILGLAGDSGARVLLKRHAEQVVEVAMEDDAVLRDFDTVDSLATLPQRLRPVDVGS